MRQGYITYWEGYDETGKVVSMGNHSVHVDYTQFVDEDNFLTSISQHLLKTAKELNPLVKTAVIKGLFKL